MSGFGLIEMRWWRFWLQWNHQLQDTRGDGGWVSYKETGKKNEANTFNRLKCVTNKVESLHWKLTTTSGGHVQSTVAELKYSHPLFPADSPKWPHYFQGAISLQITRLQWVALCPICHQNHCIHSHLFCFRVRTGLLVFLTFSATYFLSCGHASLAQ